MYKENKYYILEVLEVRLEINSVFFLTNYLISNIKVPQQSSQLNKLLRFSVTWILIEVTKQKKRFVVV